MTYLAHIGEQNLDIWSKNMLRNTDMEHLKGMRHHGVDSVCIHQAIVRDSQIRETVI